jgi:hypothetical protein
MRYQLMRAALTAALCLAATGCGSKLVKVKGKVMLDGQPVEGAVVVFDGENGGGNPAAGQTDSDGVFHLGTFQPGDGAMPGEYKVLISPPPPITTSRPEGPGMEAAMAAYAKIQEELRNNPQQPFGFNIAAKYRDPSQTPLRQTVPTSGTVVFEVQADPSMKKRTPIRATGNPMEPPKPRKRR